MKCVALDTSPFVATYMDNIIGIKKINGGRGMVGSRIAYFE
jgi:hypothetical protein